MPILEKNGERILFAHIPKTAGISIYLAFTASGWEILNLSENQATGSAFYMLRDQFGIQHIRRTGRMFRYPHPRQHAPYLIWRTWGHFTDSFAIVRHPIARLKSALKYHHRIGNTSESLDDFANRQIRFALKRPWNHWRALGGHMAPQSAFVGPKTQVLHFEGNWQAALCDRFGLDPDSFPIVNASPPSDLIHFSRKDQKLFERRYARDFRQFDYK